MEQERKELLNNESEDRAKNKTGLVLEGGGMRGIYTAGVLDVFLDEGLEFDGVIGVSAGAVHGCSFLSGQRGRSIRYYKKYCADKRFMSAENMIRTGNFVDTDFCYHELPEVLDPYDYEDFKNGLKFLTEREKEILDLYIAGKTVKEIVALTGLKESTIRFHNRNIYTKLNVHSLKQLLRYAAIMKQEEGERGKTNGIS